MQLLVYINVRYVFFVYSSVLVSTRSQRVFCRKPAAGAVVVSCTEIDFSRLFVEILAAVTKGVLVGINGVCAVANRSGVDDVAIIISPAQQLKKNPRLAAGLL